LWALGTLNAVNALLLCVPAFELSPESWLKLAAHGVFSLLLSAWFSRRTGLLSEQRGLSTLEYAVLFVLLVCAALVLWNKLGANLDKQVDTGTSGLDLALSAARRGNDDVVSRQHGDSVSVRAAQPRSDSAPVAPRPGGDSTSARAAQPRSDSAPPPSQQRQSAREPKPEHQGVLQRAREYLQSTPAAQYTLGVAAGIVQGFTPGGFVVPSPYPSSKPFELGRGLGQMAAGISETAAGIGMVGGGGAMTGGGILATATPASPAGVGMVALGVPTIAAGAATAANGVASTAAGYGTFVNAMSMSDAAAGGGSSGAGGGDPRSAPEIATELLKGNSGSVTKALPQLERMNLGQDKTVEVLQQMYKSSGRGSFIQAEKNGGKVLLSRRVGQSQPVLVIDKNGRVVQGTATIEVTGQLDPAMRAVDIVTP